MKKIKINNFSLPAKMHSFETDENDTRFSRGKLNIFYKGTTADGRFFSEDFSNNLLKTAPYAPVVAYYDEEKEDFIGHHPTKQNVYGLVDPKVEPTFEVMEDGNTWATCDVVLYTERPGQVGEIAKKIVGHSQSLELNPSTVEYVINYDEKKHFKNLEFTKGEIIGVSVLGDDQKPAFTGSAFFSASDFEEKMNVLKNYCENNSQESTEKGGGEMNHDIPDFMELSWRDISAKVAKAVQNEYSECYTILEESFDNHVVVWVYYYATNDCKYLDIQYTFDETSGEVTLGEVVEVRPTFVPVETNKTEESTQGFEEQPTVSTETNEEGTQSFTDNSNVEPKTEPVEPVEPQTTENFEEGQPQQVEPTQTVEPVEPAQTTEPVQEFQSSEDTNQEQTPTALGQSDLSAENGTTDESQNQENSSFAASIDSEQEKLERNQQREEKLNLINEYKEVLSKEQYGSFCSQVDSYQFADLAVELLKIYKESQKTDSSVIRAFYNPMRVNDSAEKQNDGIGYIIAKTLNK